MFWLMLTWKKMKAGHVLHYDHLNDRLATQQWKSRMEENGKMSENSIKQSRESLEKLAMAGNDNDDYDDYDSFGFRVQWENYTVQMLIMHKVSQHT